MFKEIQKAESAIKAGDTKTGFEILRGYLAENPDSERAWWVMSGLVQREERARCLEQVLRINPNNRMAQETLDKLLTSPPVPETKPQRDLPSSPDQPPSPSAPMQTFLFKKGSAIHITLIDQGYLYRAQAAQRHIPPIRDAVTNGEIPRQYLSGLKTVPLDSIQVVEHSGSVLAIRYQDGPGEHSLKLPFEEKAKARTVLGSLTKRLGPDYMVQTKPVRTGIRMGLAALLTLGAAAFVAFILWTLPQIGAGLVAESWRTRMVGRLLESLGYGGVIGICAVLILAALALSSYLLLKPPVRTELVRRPWDM